MRTEAEVRALAREVDPRFSELVRCGRCKTTLGGGRTSKRILEVGDYDIVLVIFCDACDQAIPSGSVAEAAWFNDQLHRPGDLVLLPTLVGRA